MTTLQQILEKLDTLLIANRNATQRRMIQSVKELTQKLQHEHEEELNKLVEEER